MKQEKKTRNSKKEVKSTIRKLKKIEEEKTGKKDEMKDKKKFEKRMSKPRKRCNM